MNAGNACLFNYARVCRLLIFEPKSITAFVWFGHAARRINFDRIDFIKLNLVRSELSEI